jgi:hypothetical protein
VAVPAPACAVEAGSVGDVVAESLPELPEPPGEQPTTPKPAARTQSATDMDARSRMESLRDRMSGLVMPAHYVSGFIL